MNPFTNQRSHQQILAQTPQVKICGITHAEQALACIELGAHAIGCVFYPPSPRFVSTEQAEAICRALPPSVSSVGVFVNEALSEILKKVERCGLWAVQLHGQESPPFVGKLRKEGVTVIKTLFANGRPHFAAAVEYDPRAFLAECVGEHLPGGEGRIWKWSRARRLAKDHPLILAGGLTYRNVSEAIHEARPDAVDVCSGVEAQPGKKDLKKVKLFLEAVGESTSSRGLRRIFP